jgi:hypothetical protein
VLVDMRARLARSARPDRIFEVTVEACASGPTSRRFGAIGLLEASDGRCPRCSSIQHPAAETTTSCRTRRTTRKIGCVGVVAGTRPGGGVGPREVDVRYLRGTRQVDQGHQLGRQVAVVLAWQVTQCAICLRCAGIGCLRIVPRPCRGFLTSSWRASAASSGAPGAAIIVVTGAGITVLNSGIPVRGDSRRR